MNQNLCDILEKLSQETWERIKFSRNRSGLKIYETTITQNLLYSIHKNNNSIPIIIEEANDEKTNGNDLEIYLKINGGYIFLPTQAKIIYSNYKYIQMDHIGQIDDLINYAKLNRGFPLYLLYNYVMNFIPSQSICGIKLKDSHYGCTLTSAKYLYNNFAYQRLDKNGNLQWIIPSFHDLHPSFSFPWIILGCCQCSDWRQIIFDKFDLNIRSLKLFSYNELKDSNWREIDFDKEYEKEIFINETYNEYKKFSPKFRIIIGG